MKKIALSLSFASLLATSAFALPIINQSTHGNVAPSDGAGYSWIMSNGNYGSVFTANTTSLDGAGIYISDPTQGGGWGINSSAVFTIGLYDSAANLLGSGSFSTSTGGWHDVFFNDIAVTNGAQYFVFASATQDYAGVTTYFSDGASPGTYFLNNGSISFAGWQGWGIDSRIFTNDGAGAVPEPTSLLLMGLGLLGLGIARKRATK